MLGLIWVLIQFMRVMGARLDWSKLSPLVTQDIKTQPQSTPFNYNTKKVNLCTLLRV